MEARADEGPGISTIPIGTRPWKARDNQAIKLEVVDMVAPKIFERYHL
jgi:hypothetical protein